MLLRSHIIFYFLYCTRPPNVLHDYVTPSHLSAVTNPFFSFPLLPVTFLPISLRKKKQSGNQKGTSTNSHHHIHRLSCFCACNLYLSSFVMDELLLLSYGAQCSALCLGEYLLYSRKMLHKFFPLSPAVSGFPSLELNASYQDTNLL